jgi:hypothetical protein
MVDLDVWEDQHIHDEGNDLATVIIEGRNRRFRYKTDIKGSRSSAQWLLVEDHKITLFNTQIYVIGVLESIPDGKEFKQNPYRFVDKQWTVKIKGYAFNKDLMDHQSKRGWIEYRAGQRLYRPLHLQKCMGKHRELNYSDFQGLLHNCIEAVPGNQSAFIGPRLDCKLNYGLPISWLRNTEEDWKKFVSILKTQSAKL